MICRPVFSSSASHRALLLGVAACLTAGATSLSTPRANADEPRKASEPAVLREPGELTQVVDAFDEDDPFDLHLSLGYQSTWKSANILRETSIVQPGLATGIFTPSNLNVAKYKETTSRLNTRADIGIYRDVALVVRMPIILANERELTSLNGSAEQQPVILQGAPGEQLFRLPFKSPKRSGIEYLAVGLDAAILNQARDFTKPTWVVGIEGRFNVSEPMHACNDNPSQVNTTGANRQEDCAHPSDINRDGIGEQPLGPDTSLVEGRFNGGRDPGVSRGVTGLSLHTYISRRVKYIEPYGGFRTLFEFQNSSSDYGGVDLEGSLVNHPPMRGTFLVGLNVFPWEVRDQFQRITLDFRFTGTYVSEGRDYSELFDALGSSDARTLRTANFAEYRAGEAETSVLNPNSQKVFFTGLTDVQQHGVYTLSTSFTWQAGEFVKFNAGGAFTLSQGHLITFDQACNPDFDDSLARSGPCRARTSSGTPRATGVPNPNFRKTINDPGHRFKVDDATQFDAWLNATVMF